MNADLLHVHLVTHKEVPNVDVPHALAARSLPIALKENSTLVVLQQEILNDSITLC